MITRFDARLNPQAPAALSVFRIVFGLLYFLHGTSKVFGWPGAQQVPTGAWPLWWAGVIEVILGALITVGFATRPAAFIAAGEMAVAFFTQHLPGGFWPINNGGELAVFVLLRLPAAGVLRLGCLRRRGAAPGRGADCHAAPPLAPISAAALRARWHRPTSASTMPRVAVC
jgi:putative oxidoreductase